MIHGIKRREIPECREARCHLFRRRYYCAMWVFSALLWLMGSTNVQAQNVSIGTAAANNSALLHLESTSKGLLPPRLSNFQMLAVASPATGDLVYNTTYANYYYYNGTIWTPIVGSGWSIWGDLGTNPSTNFLGTKDAQDLVQKTHFVERMRVYNGGNVGLRNSNNNAESLIFWDASNSSLYTAFKAGVQDSTIHYTLPLADGAPGAALDDSLGTMGWHVFATVGGSLGVTLWNRGSGAVALEGVGKNNTGSGKYTIAATEYDKASGEGAAAFGDSNTASGKLANTTGGSNNDVSSQGSVVRGGAWNSASGNNSSVEGGLYNSVSGQNGTVLDGDSNSISGSAAVVINGANNSAAGQDNLIFGSGCHPTGSDQLVFDPPGAVYVGIQTSSPTEAMDVVGNVKFSGALKPNGNGGSSSQYLLSAGSSSPPTWGGAAFSVNNWRLTGNTGSSPSINFIGTTDSNAFVIRTNNTERMRIHASGQVSINTTTKVHQLQSFLTGTTDETAAIYGVASGATTSQSLGVWGRVNTSNSNSGTIACLATGSGNTTSGQTDAALQLSQGEFAMGRTTAAPSTGTDVEAATSGTGYSQEGPSGVIQLSIGVNLTSTAPVAGVYQDLGTVTINNEYITASSIILAGVVAKINGGGDPDPSNSVYRVDVQSRAAGSCVLRIGMFPFVTSTNTFEGSDYIRIGYIVLNPGK